MDEVGAADGEGGGMGKEEVERLGVAAAAGSEFREGKHNFMDLLLGVGLVLGVMILVHVWGHFIAARIFGVRVDVFSIGFGPRLFGWKSGPTDYRVSALPLGCYVRMAGEAPAEVYPTQH